jgi:Probable Zinc-ribbon domain
VPTWKAKSEEVSLEYLYPALAKEWHPIKNPMSPRDIRSDVYKSVWWICPNGHEYQSWVYYRTVRGRGCPFCSGPGRRFCEENCLQTVNPALAQEWHPSKNGSLIPQNIKARACETVWWLCPKGHSYQTMVHYRTVRGWGCPYCSGRKVSKENCLKTVNPGLAQEWHPTKNGNLTPKDVTGGSTKAVWWRCKNGHEWRTKISSRSRGTGCPHCPRKPKVPEKSLLELNPALAKQWHPDKNGTLIPSQISGGSSWKAWWKCPKGHEWEAMVHNRNHGSGCPYCDGRLVSKEACLATLYPKLAREWHQAKNEELAPQMVSPKNIKKVWWRCREGHEWEAKIVDRVKKDKGCPICRGTGP